jgi:hypothetical protein
MAFSDRPFVFIDILALFREFWCAAVKLPPLNRNLADLAEPPGKKQWPGSHRWRPDSWLFQTAPLFS